MNFSALASIDLPGLGARLDRFTHRSGLQHFHLSNPAVAPSFMIGFPTPPAGNDGRPHVLEHLVLSGSQSYPVRKVFWRANERSLASFMNAMTDDMATYFPFVTPHLDDYNMLLGVYLDSVFHPQLNRADFMEEGFRLEQGANGQAVFQGVVFNEMISAFEDPDRHLQAALSGLLFPNSALGFESGGDPLVIPSLTHEKIVAFHQQCYHPAHAVVFTAGPDELIQSTHQGIETALASGAWSAPPPAPLMPGHELFDRRRVDMGLPTETQDHQLVMAWPLGHVTDGVAAWVREALTDALWFDESSPFSLAQQAAQLGRLGSMRGVHTFGNEQWLVLHFQGLEPEDLAPAEALVRQILSDTINDGLTEEHLHRFRRDIDIQLRRTTDLGPEGALSRFFHAVKPALYGHAESLPTLWDIQGVSDQWREAVVDPEQVKALASFIKNNPSELVLHVWPDGEFHARRAAAMDKLLEQATARLRGPDVQATVAADADILSARQADAGSPDALPSFPVSRIPRELPQPPEVNVLGEGLIFAPAQSQGLVSLSLAADMSHLSANETRNLVSLIEVFMSGLGEMGLSWQDASVKRQRAGVDICGHMMAGMTGQGQLCAMGQISGMTRVEDAQILAQTLADMVEKVNLTDPERLAYLMLSERDENQNALMANGAEWVQARLAFGMHRRGELEQMLGGLPSVVYWQRLVQQFERQPAEALNALSTSLRQLHELNWSVVVRGDRRGVEAGRSLLQRLRANGAAIRTQPVHSQGIFVPSAQQIALLAPQRTGGQHGTAWVAPMDLGMDSASLMLLGQVLTQEELWPRVREKGGAYGGGARWERGMFKMSTWRDPRVTGTFNDFEATRSRGLLPFSADQIEHAKRLVFQIQDRPLPPMARARQAVEYFWRGDQGDSLQQWREHLLDANAKTMQQAAERWLAGPALSRVAFIDERQVGEVETMGLHVEPLPVADADSLLSE